MGDITSSIPKLDPVSVGLEGAQFILGAIQTAAGAKKAKKYLAQRSAYKTPQEFTDYLNATEANASQGYDPTTLSYMTSQTDQAFASTLGAATRLGADPNTLSADFSQKINAMMQIGAGNHEANMKNFGAYLSALNTMGDNKAAEWKSEQDLLKDKQQQAAGDKAQGVQNMGNAVNSFIGSENYAKIAALYGTKPDPALATAPLTKDITGRIPTDSLPPLTGGNLALRGGGVDINNLPADAFFKKY